MEPAETVAESNIHKECSSGWFLGKGWIRIRTDGLERDAISRDPGLPNHQ